MGAGVEHGQVVPGRGVLGVQPERLGVGPTSGGPVAEVAGHVGQPEVCVGRLRSQLDGPAGDLGRIGQPAGPLQDDRVRQRRGRRLRGQGDRAVAGLDGLAVPALTRQQQRPDPVPALVVRDGGERAGAGGEPLVEPAGGQQHGRQHQQQLAVGRILAERRAQDLLRVVEPAQLAQLHGPRRGLLRGGHSERFFLR